MNNNNTNNMIKLFTIVKDEFDVVADQMIK